MRSTLIAASSNEVEDGSGPGSGSSNPNVSTIANDPIGPHSVFRNDASVAKMAQGFVLLIWGRCGEVVSATIETRSMMLAKRELLKVAHSRKIFLWLMG